MIRRRLLARLGHAMLTAIAGVLTTAAFALGRANAHADDVAFPHEKHARLFPTGCASCHAGITTGDSSAMFPAAAQCVDCHNGRDVKPVMWTAWRGRQMNLRFDHLRHLRRSGSSSTRMDCATCHGPGASPTQMIVAKPRPETCVSCHAHEAPAHLAIDSPCATCHAPLARTGAFSDSAVAALPRPVWHNDATFLSTHGTAAVERTSTCAACHTRESCARCHLNSATLQPIPALGSDPRIARLVRDKPAVYPVPPSHRELAFTETHGGMARANIQSCATCHAQASCRTCHTGPLGARWIDALPKAEPGRGVQLRPVPTVRPPGPAIVSLAVDTTRVDTARLVRVHPYDFVRNHGPTAATRRLDCAGCHAQQYCTNCHQGTGQRRYHAYDYVYRHASEAYARETNCTSCHNTEVFCRSCHAQSAGIAANSQKRSGPAHSGQPLWLLQHGEAARQSMPSCVSCHQQTDCMKCHSSFGSRISPHGPNFDAARMQKKNPTLCTYCHLGPPR
jgi:predicted CXXCH cytochrome family protein